MPKKTATITLGAVNVEVPQFTLGQLERIADWLAENQGAQLVSLANVVRSWHNLIVIAFERSSPKYAPEQITELEMDVTELREAGNELLRLAGLQPAEDSASPEAMAPQGASPTTLTTSSESSPPDAATPLH